MNRLGIDLTGKTVVVKKESVKPEFQDSEYARAFKCDGGFGCKPDTIGSMIIGEWLDTPGKSSQIRGHNVEKLYEGEESPKKASKKTSVNNYGFQVGQKMWMVHRGKPMEVTVAKIRESDAFSVEDADLNQYYKYGWELYESLEQLKELEEDLSASASKKTADQKEYSEQDMHTQFYLGFKITWDYGAQKFNAFEEENPDEVLEDKSIIGIKGKIKKYREEFPMHQASKKTASRKDLPTLEELFK